MLCDSMVKEVPCTVGVLSLMYFQHAFLGSDAGIVRSAVEKHLAILRPRRYAGHWSCAHLVGHSGGSPARIPGVLHVRHVLLLRVFVGLKLAVIEHMLNPLSRRWSRGRR